MVDEDAHLALANKHISQAERLIGEQQARIEELSAVGADTVEAARLLKNFRDALVQFRIHKELIIAAGGKEI
jgi:hypothetical protein